MLFSGLALAQPAQRFERAWQAEQPYTPALTTPSAEVDLRVDAPPPDDTAAWQPVSLPVSTSRQVPRSGGAPQLQVRWYRVIYTVPAGLKEPLALYLPRVSGGAVQVIQFDAGHWQMRWDGSDHRREQWNRPIWVDLGPAPPAGTRLDLAVGVVHEAGAGLRVARICVGPRDELEGRLGWRRLLQIVAPQVGSMTFLALGTFSFIFWLGRRREHAYLLFSLSSVVWLLRNLHYYIDMPTDPAVLSWFWWTTNASLSWVMVLVYLFAFRFDPRRYPWLEWSLVGFVIAMTVATAPFSWSPISSLLQQHLINTVVALGVTGWLTVVAWRGGGPEFRLIAAALWVAEAFGLHDLLLVAGRITPESIYLLPFASLVLLLSFLNAVQSRYAQAIDQVERTNAQLEGRLAEREAELRANHERLRGIEREQALLLERQRLMRDMHDGLGSTLMSSLVLVEQGRLEAPAVALLLRECVDDLRLVIDSLEPIGHDLITLLALLRHRLGRRLEAAGLQLAWEVDDLPPLNWLYPPDALQILRAVQEVLTNVLKHAGAQHIRIATLQLGDRVEVLIEDDGCGFDTEEAPQGRGLRHLAQRAARLGGEVRIDSAPGRGTRVRLHLPLQRNLAA
ncbi:ATP-binding protein [Ideonella sp.]|uniref:sensor histidine kinase n=1 Tax=Ideonella sp. TaxID=1929293 RepID=UPI00351ACCC6